MASKNQNNILIISGVIITAGLVYYNYDSLKKSTSNEKLQPKAKNNAEHLKLLHPTHRDKFQRLITLLERAGYNPIITSSYRGFDKQAQLKKADSRNAKPGFSAHNYGLAMDVVLNKNGKSYGMKTPASDWISTGIVKAAENYGLSWGGTIPGYYDPVHFQVKGIDTTKLYNLALKQFKTSDPRKIRGNELKLV